MKALLSLSREELGALATALTEGRLTVPLSDFGLRRVLGRASTPELLSELTTLIEAGPAGALRLAASMLGLQRRSPRPELVWTGPDETQTLRATSTVVEELFQAARHRVMLAGFVIVRGEAVFGALGKKMDETPELAVTLYLNVPVQRGAGPDATVNWFATEFRQQVWPGKRLPIVYFDPRSLIERSSQRAVLHAKCVVVDSSIALVTSANFTPHAQSRNIELGVRLEDPELSQRIEAQFDDLVKSQHLERLPGT